MVSISTFPFRRFASPGSILVLILLAVGLAACGGGGSNAGRGEVVFTAVSEGNADIYRVDNESGLPVRLTSAAGEDFAPAWSPKKNMIAFLSRRNGAPALWLMDWNGASKRQISDQGLEIKRFRWAPDSKSIGLEIATGRFSWIAVLDVESGEVEALTSRAETAEIGDWSPDGWSPDGRKIAFSRTTGTAGNATSNLVVTDQDGDKSVNVAPDDFDEASFRWAPDSKHIMFVSEATGNAEIYIVTPDGKDTKQLTSNRVIDAAPRWNSNGSSILFLSEGNGSFDIYSMNKDGEQQKRMTSISDVILEADW